MKAEFLKLAGVKTDKQFYAKYPDEASFFKAHPQAKKMIKKAQGGTMMSGMNNYLQAMQNLPNMQNVMQGQMQSPGVNAGMYNNSVSNNTVAGPMLAPGSYNDWDIDNNKVPDLVQGNMSAYKGPQDTKAPDGGGLKKGLESLPGLGGELMKGYNNLRAGRRAKKEAQKWANVTDVQAKAAESEDVDSFRQMTDYASRKRKAFMPVTTGEEFFPVYGVGTNVLAKNGTVLRGGGEIQNTYAPGTLYDDLGYQPLTNPDQIKAYRKGGYVHKAQTGSELLSLQNIGASGGGTPWGAIGGIGSGLAGNLTGNDGGGQIGGAIGGAAGMAIGGPVGQAIGSTLGTLAGGLLDTNDRDQRKAEARTKNNMNRMMSAQFSNNMQQQFGAYAEDGANINPQIISEFGGNKLSYLLSPPNDADMLRAGGHIRGSYVAPNASGLSTMEEGGELNTHWGGYAEPMSYNPYLPDGGETVMFRGNSHEEYDGQGNTGIGVSYGGGDEANVEVERGEPATKLKDGGTGEDNLVVYGNLKIPKYGVDLLGDKNAKNKKFKNYVSDLSRMETKQNKLIDKSSTSLDELDVNTPFDKLELASYEANIKGGNMKLKEIADKKIKAAGLQSAINDTAEEYGLVADDLAKGKTTIDKKAMKLKEAMFGTSIRKFEEGGDTPKASTYDPKKVEEIKELYRQAQAKGTNKSKEALALQQKFHEYFPEIAKEIILSSPNVTAKAKQMGYKNISDLSKADKNVILNTNVDEYMGPRTEQYMAALAKLERPRSEDVAVPKVTAKGAGEDASGEDAVFDVKAQKRNPWVDMAGQALDYFRPSDQEALSANQLMGEAFALSSNQLEPVQAQFYRPELDVPYDISLQDQLNEITASERAAQRMAGYNPAAQSMIAGQSYGAKSRVLADQFRANQAMKDQVYSRNRATMNDAQLKNLAIADTQYTRQAQAKSNTKAVAQEALNSISSKYAQNALENRTLGVYENLYNYRYDKAGRAVNMNAPQQFNTGVVYNPIGEPNYRKVTDKNGNISFEPINFSEQPSTTGIMPINKEEGVAKSGAKIKKNYSQSSIVKMFK